MIWWYWIVLGLSLAALEVITPGGFFFIFFAVAAVVVGLLDVVNLLESDTWQWALFSALSLVCLAFFRKPLLERMNRSARTEAVDSLVGELAVASSDIAPGAHGRAEVRGTTWTVRNVDAVAVAGGERCRVVAVNGGLELDIRSERSR